MIHNNVGGVSTAPGPDGTPVTTNVGGFMQDLMSPIDPIFFLHHANIDRLWDVWTRKQQKLGLPILPDGYLTDPPVRGSDYYRWSREPFLFFSDPKGQPVTMKTAGDYATIGAFNYEYQPGSGEEVVEPTMAAATKARSKKQVLTFNGKVTSKQVSATQVGAAVFKVPPSALQARTVALFAKVTIELPSVEHAGRFMVFVNAPDRRDLGASSPYYAGTFAMFGHRDMAGPFTFTIPLSNALTRMRTRKLLAANAPLVISVVQEPAHVTHPESAVEIRSVVLEAY
jgi:hypothetical protein